jgi:hypothetical protein
LDLDDAIDELYGAAPEQFVAERARLARGLREEGKRDEAERVAKLRKPTAAAALLNRLAREERRDVDLLLDAGHRLRESQEGMLRGGDRATFERARATERDALRRLLASAERAGASASVLRQVEQTLRTASVSEEGRELLARGRFETPLEPGGFGLVPDVPAAAAPPRRQRRGAEERRALQQAVRDARARVREAEKQAEALEREAHAARAAADEARAAVDEARRELERAERAAYDA